jgi:hypothetical protein
LIQSEATNYFIINKTKTHHQNKKRKAMKMKRKAMKQKRIITSKCVYQ